MSNDSSKQGFSHLNAADQPTMVDVSGKMVTERMAVGSFCQQSSGNNSVDRIFIQQKEQCSRQRFLLVSWLQKKRQI